MTAPLEEALVRSLDERALNDALAAAVDGYRRELEQTDAALADRLGPMLGELLA